MEGGVILIFSVFVCAIKGQMVILTPNVSTPCEIPSEAVELTCRTTGVELTALRWTYDNTSMIVSTPRTGPLVFNFQRVEAPFDIFPENRSSAFISYTIISATIDNTTFSVQFVAVMVVNPALLFSRYGYTSLQCGGLTRTDSYNFGFVEVPSVPENISFQLIYNGNSVNVEIEIPVHSSQCRNTTYLNISLILDTGDTPRPRIANIADNCTSTCSLSLNIPLKDEGDSFQVLVSVGNNFGESNSVDFSFPLSVQSIFNVSVLYNKTDCKTYAQCTVFQTARGDAQSCSLKYGADSATTQLSINESVPLNDSEDDFEENTTYSLEGVLTFAGNNQIYHLQLQYTTGVCPGGTPNTMDVAVGVGVGVGVAILLVLLLTAIVIFLVLRRKRYSKTHEMTEEPISTRNPVSTTSPDGETQENDMELVLDHNQFRQPDQSKEEWLEQMAMEQQREEQETVSKEDTALSAS